jgi:hypothetical protein
MEYLQPVFMVFTVVCTMAALNLLADIAQSLKGLQRREFYGIPTMLERIRGEIEKSARVTTVLAQ